MRTHDGSGQLRKHVASKHLRSTSVMCNVCRKMLCRKDVLWKHKKAHCRGMPVLYEYSSAVFAAVLTGFIHSEPRRNHSFLACSIGAVLHRLAVFFPAIFRICIDSLPLTTHSLRFTRPSR
ncbi:hypothetical protein BKA93DRAFT_788886 [Sparassis latifolia]